MADQAEGLRELVAQQNHVEQDNIVSIILKQVPRLRPWEAEGLALVLMEPLDKAFARVREHLFLPIEEGEKMQRLTGGEP